jgi:hypothetical protein
MDQLRPFREDANPPRGHIKKFFFIWPVTHRPKSAGQVCGMNREGLWVHYKEVLSIT